MTIEIHRETFKPNGETETHKLLGLIETGMVEITYGHERIVAEALRYTNGSVYARGFVGRYRTGNKAWRATVYADDRGTNGRFGRDDRSGRFQKMQGISYEPEAWKAAR